MPAPSTRRKKIPSDSLLQLRQRLDCLPKKSSERTIQIDAVATLYGVSIATDYRALAECNRPHAANRADHGKPRILQSTEMERYPPMSDLLSHFPEL